MFVRPGSLKVDMGEKEKAPPKKRKPFQRGKFDKLIGYGTVAKGAK